MTPTNGKASTIFIRNLSKKDNDALKLLRTDFSTEFNTVAVLQGIYAYLNQKKTIGNQKAEIEALHRNVQELTTSLEQIKDSIKDYFAYQIEKETRQEQLLKILRTFVQEPKGTAKRKSGKARS